jgi:flagellar M-ring protein FliF
MEMLRQMWTQIKGFVLKMSLQQRLIVGGLTLLVAASIVGLALWGSKEEFVQLSPELAPELTDSVIKKLEAKGVEFKLERGVVYVNKGMRDKLYFELYGEGVLPEGKNPFEWLFNQDITSTSGKRNQQWLDTVRRRLENMIGSLDPVAAANVQLTKGSEYPYFGADPRQSKASVRLKLKSGKALSKQNVMAIAQLVSGAVELLAPENVAIVDTAGKYYKVPKEDDAISWTTDQLELKAAHEDYYKEKVQECMRSIVGPNICVMCDVTLDMTEKRSSTHDVKPVEDTEERIRTEKGGVEGGVPGVDGQLPETGAGVGSASVNGGTTTIPTSVEERESKIVNKELGYKNIDEINRPGSIKDKTISVVVPYEAAIRSVGGKVPDTEDEKTKVIQQNLKEWAAVVANACNIQEPEKNIKMTLMPFIEPVPPELPGKWDKWTAFLEARGAQIGLGILALIAMVLIYLVVRRSMPSKLLKEIERVKAEIESREPFASEIAVEMTDAKLGMMRERIKEVVRRNPRTVANLVRRWMMKG